MKVFLNSNLFCSLANFKGIFSISSFLKSVLNCNFWIKVLFRKQIISRILSSKNISSEKYEITNSQNQEILVRTQNKLSSILTSNSFFFKQKLSPSFKMANRSTNSRYEHTSCILKIALTKNFKYLWGTFGRQYFYQYKKDRQRDRYTSLHTYIDRH